MNIQEIRLECLKEVMKYRESVLYDIDRAIEDAGKLAAFVNQDGYRVPRTDNPHRD